MSYWGAAAFQWVNPKAWVMAVGAISTYTPLQGYFTNVVVISTVFALINAPTIGIWAGFGSMLRNVLRDPRWLRVFNGRDGAAVGRVAVPDPRGKPFGLTCHHPINCISS